MIPLGLHEKVFPVVKVAMIVESLAMHGISSSAALHGIRLSKDEMESPNTRVSLDDVIKCFDNAVRLLPEPYFAFQTGLRFHVSTYGMYGFAILCSTNFRSTMNFAVKYQQLATPLAEISFKEEDGHGIWTIVPIPHPNASSARYQFLVELQLGIHLSLHRDVMGPSFTAQAIHVTYASPERATKYPEICGCPVLFNQRENRLVFDAAWLDATPQLGNDLTYSTMLRLCDELMGDLQLDAGLAGKVREYLLINLLRPTSLHTIAKHLHTTERTLRRKLEEENTSFRTLVDELRMNLAIKYLRDTDLSVEDIAYALGFSDAANFRHAFRRWTNDAPRAFRNLSR